MPLFPTPPDPNVPHVVVPFVEGRLTDATRASVATCGLPVHYARLDPADDGGYARLFCRLWSACRTFVICEHDVAPRAEHWRQIATCGHDWCFFDYDVGPYPDGPKFGLVRFSRPLMVAHPNAADRALWHVADQSSPVPWWQVDSTMARYLTILLQTPAPEGDTHEARERARHPWMGSGCVRHTPPVAHHHQGAPSGPLRP